VKQDRGPCRVFRIDMTSGATTGTLDLPASCGHAGGLARGPAGRLFAADTRTVYEVELTRAASLGRVVRTIKLLGNVKGSFAAGSADALWLGSFAREGGGKLFKVPFGTLKPTVAEADATHVVPLPTAAQGAAFDPAGRLWITRSTSRFGELRRLDPASGATQAQYSMPIGVEDLSFDADGGLWTVSEAGSRRWLRWTTFFPVVFRLDPAKLR
jgi:sugar lactone lactonase YvrE